MTDKEVKAVKLYAAKHKAWRQQMDKLAHIRTLGYGNCLWMLRSHANRSYK